MPDIALGREAVIVRFVNDSDEFESIVGELVSITHDYSGNRYIHLDVGGQSVSILGSDVDTIKEATALQILAAQASSDEE